MVLRDEVLTKPTNLTGEKIQGRLTLDYDWDGKSEPAILQDIELEGDGRSGPNMGGKYGLYTPPGRFPNAHLYDPKIHGYDKGCYVGGVALFNPHFWGNGDHCFIQERVLVRGGKSGPVGGLPGDHADAFQCAGATRRVVIADHDFFPDLTREQIEYVNSCVFWESKFGPVRKMTVMRCILRGGNYHIYSWKDENQLAYPGGPPADHGPPRMVGISQNESVYPPRYGPVAWNALRPDMAGNSWQEHHDPHGDDTEPIGT